jgi:hypothetical protein
MKTKPWMMLVAMMAGWLNRQQQDAIMRSIMVLIMDGAIWRIRGILISGQYQPGNRRVGNVPFLNRRDRAENTVLFNSLDYFIKGNIMRFSIDAFFN